MNDVGRPARPRWTLVVNDGAGSSDDAVVEQVADTLRREGDVDVERTGGPDDLDAVLTRVPRDGVVVVLGGDGSLHAVVAATDRCARLDDVVVALVPMGTGNDFARTIGADIDDPVAAAQQLLTGAERRADLFRVSDGEIVVNAAHVGVGADATRASSRWKSVLGPVGYAIGAVVSGVRTEGFRGRVTIDGEAVPGRGRILQVAVGNGRYIGGGAPLLPDADPFDGVIEVVVSRADSRLRRLGYAWRLRRGEHVERPDTTALRGHTVSVRVKDGSVLGNVDGETTAPARDYTWTNEAGAWRLLTPTPQAS